MNNTDLLQRYLLNLIEVSADILKNFDNTDSENVGEVGEILCRLEDFRKNSYIELPF